LIDLYWQVGATISRKIKAAEWERKFCVDFMRIIQSNGVSLASIVAILTLL